MKFARPSGDQTTAGWTDERDSLRSLSAKIAAVSFTGATYVRRRMLGAPTTTPRRVVMFLADDQRDDDFTATMTAGPRSGERVMETVITRIRDVGLRFTQMRCDDSTCQPGRTSLLTGLLSVNHDIHDESIAPYYDKARVGIKAARKWQAPSFKEWHGPMEFDLAAHAGLGDLPVYRTDQQVGGISASRRTSVGTGDSADDLQAFTGNLPSWLRAHGVLPVMLGKYMNGYGRLDSGAPYNVTGPLTNQFVPPGWERWWAFTDDQQDHYHVGVCESSGTNPVGLSQTVNASTGSAVVTQPANGKITTAHIGMIVHFGRVPSAGATFPAGTYVTAVSGTSVTLSQVALSPISGGAMHLAGRVGTVSALDYDYEISALSWSGGELSVTLSAPLPVALTVGEEVAIDGVTGNTNYNIGVTTVTAYTDATHFKCALANPGGTAATLTTAKAYPRKLYPERQQAAKAIEFLDSFTDDDSFFMLYASRSPHGSISHDGLLADDIENERRYLNTKDGSTVPNSQALRWGGASGTVSPAANAAELNTTRKDTWAQRQTMAASFDDSIKDLLDYCDDRWGVDGYVVVYTSDNGYAYGDHADTEGTDTWSPVGGKGWVWESSNRLPLFIRDPGRDPADVDTLAHLLDLPLTLLDYFAAVDPALRLHHAHQKRDGHSLLRLLDDAHDASADRASLILGKYKSVSDAQAIVDGDLHKLVRAFATPSDRRLFDLTPLDPDPGNLRDASHWETLDIAPTDPTTATALAARLDNLIVGRYDPASDVNTARSV